MGGAVGVYDGTVEPPPPPPPPPPPIGKYGDLLPARMPQSDGNPVNVGSYAQLVSAINGAKGGQIINIAQTITGAGSIRLGGVFNRGNPVTVQCEPGVKLVGNGSGNLLHVTGQGWRLKNIDVSNGGDSNIKCDDRSDHVEIVGCKVSDARRMGILVYCTATPYDIQVWDCEMWSNGSDAQLDHNMYWGTGAKGCVVANCLAVNGIAWNYQMYPKCPDVIVTCCTADGKGAWGGMVIGSEGGGETKNMRVVGLVATNGARFGVWPYKSGSGNTVMDSIGSGNPSADFSSGSGVSYTNCKSADPKYVNRNAGNYRLQAGSPAIGHIQSERFGYVPAKDKDGKARVTADAGCYAYLP